MITEEIQFHAPRDLDEVLELLSRYGDEAKLLGGGMSLVPTMNLGLARPSIVISLNHVAGLAGIEADDGYLRIGGTSRHAEVAASDLVRAHAAVLASAAAVIGDVQVRNRGTVGGSVAHADPAADYLPVLVALGAQIAVRSSAGERRIPAADFFVDIMLTALNPDEVVTEIAVPLDPGRLGGYRRLARVEGSFAIVNAAAVRSSVSGWRVAIGGVGARPVLVDLSQTIDGGLDEAALEQAADLVRAACPEPFGDLNGDPEYRREMAAVYARRALSAAAQSAA